MWLPKGSSGERRAAGGNKVVAVAIDKNKGSQNALKWAIDNLLTAGQTVVLIHIITKSSSASFGNNGAVRDVNGAVSTHKQLLERQTKDLFLTFHCFCTRKDIQCLDVILEDTEIAKALTEYVSYSAIENLVLGAPSRHGFIRMFKSSDIPSNVSKGAPDFCTVYVIHKGKISSVRNASRPAPFISPIHEQIQDQFNNNVCVADARPIYSFSPKAAERTLRRPRRLHEDNESFKSPFTRGSVLNGKLCGELSESDTDISFVSSGRPSTDRVSPMLYESMDSGQNGQVSTSSEHSFGSVRLGAKGTEISSQHEFSSSSFDSGRTSTSSQNTDDVEAEMRRLKLELQKMMDLYSTACKEALTAKQKAMELHQWRIEEERRLEEARLAEEAALIIAEREKAKCRAAMDTAEAAQRISELEARRRLNAEMKALKHAEERQAVLKTQTYFRCRIYTIDDIEEATEFFAQSRKIGEGGYGPVFKCFLDHTPVAVKVLRPDAAQGRSQFQQEVELLSCMRHPNMVILLGACPEYGCLVYEYMAKGSLEDRLFRRGNTPALPWQLRFRIAAEIATGLLFLHQTKPEPIVHRDLKPANILLDHNYVSKISDVGLARLVPPSVADEVTQYRVTSTAGTFCYIDPEYQQTGMLGVKSDIYSLGIILLQLITAKPAMGLTHHVEQAIEKGTFGPMLDPSAGDWPVGEALCFAKLALKCSELRRKDRPDLGKVVLPELNRLRGLAEDDSMIMLGGIGIGIGNATPGRSPNNTHVSSITQDVLSDPSVVHSDYNSSKSLSSSSSLPEKLSRPSG